MTKYEENRKLMKNLKKTFWIFVENRKLLVFFQGHTWLNMEILVFHKKPKLLVYAKLWSFRLRIQTQLFNNNKATAKVVPCQTPFTFKSWDQGCVKLILELLLFMKKQLWNQKPTRNWFQSFPWWGQLRRWGHTRVRKYNQSLCKFT